MWEVKTQNLKKGKSWMNLKLFNQIYSFFTILVLIIVFSTYSNSFAGVSLSGTGSYSRTRYSDTDFNKNTRAAGSISYSFFVYEIELSYQQNKDHTYIQGFQNIILRDKVYSANLVMNLMPQSSPIIPFVKGGVGLLRREVSGTYESGSPPPRNLRQPSAVIGAGMKIYFTRNLGVKGEVTSYLQEGRIRTWRDNIAAMVGLTLGF